MEINGTPIDILPRLRLLPTPYSFLAATALSMNGAGIEAGSIPDDRLSANVALRTDIISDLRKSGFKGSIDIEGWHDPVYRDELEMTGQVHALNYLKNCRGGSFVANPE